MSRFSNFLDALHSGIVLLPRFSAKTRIPNAYSLSDNPEQFLENGYGVAVGAATRSAVVDEFCSNSVDRTISITMTRSVYRLENDATQFADIEKALVEDLVELQKWMLANEQLSVDESVQKIEYDGDDGIQFVSAEKFSIAALTARFLVSISEER